MMTVAQQDIKSYYDNIDILQVVDFIAGKGEHQEAQAISRALLNMHTKTKVSIEVGGAQCEIEGRTSGVLTGTRTAGKMGKYHGCMHARRGMRYGKCGRSTLRKRRSAHQTSHSKQVRGRNLESAHGSITFIAQQAQHEQHVPSLKMSRSS